MITRQLLLCLGLTVALNPLTAQLYADTGQCPVGPVPPRVAAPPVVRPAARPDRPAPGALAPPPQIGVPTSRPRPPEPVRPPVVPVPQPVAKAPAHPAAVHRLAHPYRSTAHERPAPAGFSTVTLMLVVTTPAVLAAAILRPRSRSGARPCRNG
ncbi:hypothetical protein [Streptomyces sp. BPTC-684]|uniref:hypothetical protein n=1 Tax=Streptomyces sp. BPTC-684 TaxID=3043734 RepID=UPI0024B16DBD|nr:hypothetical protein [Streptomyces sp. BPTC-684]WHM37955.1 hypothetical protein QIY60_14250 [Streptomyces sp. BPTC-684]